MKDTLDREREEKLNVRKLEDYFKEVLPALRSNLFVSLIEGRISEQEYQRFLSAYRVEMQGPLYCCVIFHTSSTHVPDGVDPVLLSMSVEREIKERLVDRMEMSGIYISGEYTANRGTGDRKRKLRN